MKKDGLLKWLKISGYIVITYLVIIYAIVGIHTFIKPSNDRSNGVEVSSAPADGGVVVLNSTDEISISKFQTVWNNVINVMKRNLENSTTEGAEGVRIALDGELIISVQKTESPEGYQNYDFYNITRKSHDGMMVKTLKSSNVINTLVIDRPKGSDALSFLLMPIYTLLGHSRGDAYDLTVNISKELANHSSDPFYVLDRIIGKYHLRINGESILVFTE